MEEKQINLNGEIASQVRDTLRETTKKIFSNSKDIDKLSECFNNSMNKIVNQEEFTEISNTIFFLMDKYHFSWTEAFIVFASLSSSMINMFEAKINSINMNSKDKEELLKAYKMMNNECLCKLPQYSGLNCLTEAVLGESPSGFISNQLYKTSSDLKKRFETLKKYGFKCYYCGRKAPEVSLELEHIHPKVLGGKDNFDNLVPACWECNRGKAGNPL